MAASTRHVLRKNAMQAASAGEVDDDDFQDNVVRRARRASLGGRMNIPSFRGLKQSTTTAALSDPGSELSRFLFLNDEDKSMGTMRAMFYALAIEKPEVRNERVVMIFEAFAIFGSLFMNGTWILYEYGSAKGGYAGYETNEAVNTVFEGVMAAALASNTMLALSSAGWWIYSILCSHSNEDLVYKSLNMLVLCMYLLWGTVLCVICGLFLAMYLNLSPQWPAVMALLVLFGILFLSLNILNGAALQSAASLEFYHLPLWFKLLLMHPFAPHKYAFGRGKEALLAEAKERAAQLERKAYHQRQMIVAPNSCVGSTNDDEIDIRSLLCNAARNKGKTSFVVDDIIVALQKDWITDAEELQSMSVERLSRYMPYGLAQQVHKLLVRY